MDSQAEGDLDVPSNNKKNTQKYESWSIDEEKFLLELLVDEANQGSRLDNGNFRKEVITGIVLPKLNAKFGRNKGYQHYRNKQRTWKRKLEPVERITKNNSGFGWDPITMRFTCPDEVWETIKTTNPNTPDLRDKVFEDYEKFKLVCGMHFAMGKSAGSLGPSVVEDSQSVGDNHIDLDEEEEEMVGGDNLDDSSQPVRASSETLAPRAPTSSNNSRGRKRKSYAGSEHDNQQSSSTINSLSEGVDKVGAGLHSLAEELRKISYRNEAWLSAIRTTPGLTEMMRWGALDIHTTQEMRDAFVAMPNAERLRWLKFKLGIPHEDTYVPETEESDDWEQNP